MRLDLESNPTALPTFQNDVDETSEFPLTTERLLKKGVAAAQSGDRDQARKLLTQVVAIDPASVDAWMWLASISDYPEELLAFLNRVLSLDPENERASEWRVATMSLMAKGFVKRAVAAYSEGNTQLAEQCIEQALAHDENSAEAWMWKASVAEDEDDQIVCLQRVLDIDAENHDAADALHQIEERRAEELRLEEERRAEEARLEEERRAEEARVAAEAARVEEERQAEEARLAEKQRIAALFADAKAVALAGDSARAVELVDEYLENRANDAGAWVFRSHVSQSVDEKLSSLEKALAADPDNAAARSAFDFLSSMSAPKPEPEIQEIVVEPQAEEVVAEAAPAEYVHEVEEPVDDEVAVAEAITEESIEADEYIEQADGYHDVAAMEQALEETVIPNKDDVSHDPYATVEYAAASPEAEDAHNTEAFELSIENTVVPNSPFDAPVGNAFDAAHAEKSACPICGEQNGVQAFECKHCDSVLSLSELETVLSNTRVNRDIVSRAVVRMEGDWNTREFSVDELTALALGHLNLGSFEPGLKYLQEASRLDPNNVVLAGQANALAIRLDEINRQREVDDARPKGKTILVVDDSATVRKLISGKLEKSGHNVISASDGVEAMERLNEQVPDLVLLDITMPRMDGYEVCKQIRANAACSHVPVVMISGKDGFFDKVRGRMAGSTGYVTKPFGPETLMKALETYLLPDAPAPVFEPELQPEFEPVV